jgi:hypothetical protein
MAILCRLAFLKMDILVEDCLSHMAIFPGAVKVHCVNNGAWIGAMDFVQACFH